jgi:ribosomal protein S4
MELKTQYKLKKKWSNWRSYKKIFLFKKKKYFISRLKWFFNNFRIICKQWIKMYNAKKTTFFTNLYKLCLKKTQSKIYTFIHYLEFRLDLTLIRLHFVRNSKEAKYLIKEKKCVSVNSFSAQVSYRTLSLDDIIQVHNLRRITIKRIKILRKDKNQIRNYLKYKKRKNLERRFRFKFLFKSKFKNFMEINYRSAMAVYIKPLFINEITNRKSTKFLKFRLIKRFWAFN